MTTTPYLKTFKTENEAMDWKWLDRWHVCADGVKRGSADDVDVALNIARAVARNKTVTEIVLKRERKRSSDKLRAAAQ